MAIYPPNTTPPQKGLNYVWNFLGSSLKTLATALQPYLGGGGSSLSGTNYVFVSANGTPIENGNELIAAYNTAKTMSPSFDKRIKVIAAPGNYLLSAQLELDTEYIDLVSLDGNRSIIIDGAIFDPTISVTANDVFIKGVDVLTKKFIIGDNLFLLKVENCSGGDYSFGESVTVSGTFTNCSGGNLSFGFLSPVVSGTFNNCIGGDNSFGLSSIVSGTFNNCVGSQGAFASQGTASGTFNNCIGGNNLFAYDGDASGTFNNCMGGIGSFGSQGTASGTFNDCIGDIGSFGGNGVASGIFNNCVGGDASFALFGTLTGKLYYCRLTSGSFQTLTGTGLMRACVDGNDVFIPSLDA